MVRRIFGVALVVTLAIVGLAGCGSGKATVMPDVLGRTLDVALSDIERAGYSGEPEVLGGGMFGVVDKSNWQVCEQLPSAGESVSEKPRLTVDRSCGGVPAESTDSPSDAVSPSQQPSEEASDQEPADEAPVEPEPQPDLTVSQENAVESAQSYLDYTGFSKKGLIKQLKYEGFSTKDATFAVEYLDPNWKAEAVESAKSYLDYSSFSRKGLIQQLEYEGFTAAQANYAVGKVGL